MTNISFFVPIATLLFALVSGAPEGPAIKIIQGSFDGPASNVRVNLNSPQAQLTSNNDRNESSVEGKNAPEGNWWSQQMNGQPQQRPHRHQRPRPNRPSNQNPDQYQPMNPEPMPNEPMDSNPIDSPTVDETPTQNQNQTQSTGGKCADKSPSSDPCSASSAQSQGPLTSDMNRSNPSGQCTEWASKRYNQLFGLDPKLNGDARLWPSDARRKSGFQVSGTPSVGAIIATQPGVLGAGGYGHVGIVEKVYENGDVCVSSWNAPIPWKTTYKKQRGQASGADYITKNGVQLKC